MFIFSKTLYLRLKHYWNNHKSRKQLRNLSDEILSDIGISRAEADQEAAKYFWQTECELCKPNKANQQKTRNIIKKVGGVF